MLYLSSDAAEGEVPESSELFDGVLMHAAERCPAHLLHDAASQNTIALKTIVAIS